MLNFGGVSWWSFVADSTPWVNHHYSKTVLGNMCVILSNHLKANPNQNVELGGFYMRDFFGTPKCLVICGILSQKTDMDPVELG